MRLGLRQPTFGARQFLVDVRRRTADLLVRSLDQFGQRQFHVIAHPIDLGQAILARLIEKRRQGLLLQPTGRLRQRGDGRRGGRRVRRAQIARRKTRSKQKRPRRTAFNFLIFLEEIWSGRRDSNPRPQPWQGCDHFGSNLAAPNAFLWWPTQPTDFGEHRSNHRSKSQIRTVWIP